MLKTQRIPKQTDEDCKIELEIRDRCLRRARKYTMKDLNELRNLQSYRGMPTNILCAVEILSQGLGLKTVITNSLTTTKEVRMRQINIAKSLDGYKNYISLIPNKNERKPNIHPSTPTTAEILSLSKRNFDKNIKNWKRDIHQWDGINSLAEIPYHLLTDRMLKERNKTSTTHSNYNKYNDKYVWSNKRSPKNKDHTKSMSESDDMECIVKNLQFDDDQKQPDTTNPIYSSTKNKWYKAKNGVIHNDGNMGDQVKVSTKDAIECLKKCVSNIRKKVGNVDSNFDQLLINEFKSTIV